MRLACASCGSRGQDRLQEQWALDKPISLRIHQQMERTFSGLRLEYLRYNVCSSVLMLTAVVAIPALPCYPCIQPGESSIHLGLTPMIPQCRTRLEGATSARDNKRRKCLVESLKLRYPVQLNEMRNAPSYADQVAWHGHPWILRCASPPHRLSVAEDH